MTTVNVPQDVLDKAMRVSFDASAEQVVVKALEEYASRHDQRKLINMLGTFSDDFMKPDPEELEKMERHE